MNISWQEKSKNFPHLPGVYLFKNSHKKVIYVGKANNLSKRLASYRNGTDDRYQIPFILNEIDDIDFIVIQNETEAFLLEDSLIKKYKPKYNIQLKDDKTYVSVEFTTGDEFPGVYIIRKKPKKSNSLIIGPFSSVTSVRTVINYLLKAFPVRTCSDTKMRRYHDRPCIFYQLKKCSAPCAGYIDRDIYLTMVRSFIDVLHGKTGRVVRELENIINIKSAELNYEDAALYRDRLYSVKRLMERQSVVVNKDINADYIGWFVKDRILSITRLIVREGRLIDKDNYIISPFIDIDNSILTYLYQIYRITTNPPGFIYITQFNELLVNLFSKLSVSFTIKSPHFKKDKELIKIAIENSKEKLIIFEGEQENKDLKELAKIINIDKIPVRIECIDISEFAGKELYGSIVTFIDGKPNKDEYRIYSIKTVDGVDDFAMISEVLRRRLSDRRKKPDLLVIDGGKGQLSAAYKVLKELKFEKQITVISLAKDRKHGKGERVFIVGRSNPIYLDTDKKSSKILINIRDEAHRFVIKHNRNKRVKKINSLLLTIDGIGKKKASLLLSNYKSINDLINIDEKELVNLLKVPMDKAVLIKKEIKNLYS